MKTRIVPFIKVECLTCLLLFLCALSCSKTTRSVSQEYRYLDSLVESIYGYPIPPEVSHILVFNQNNGVCNDCATEYLSFMKHLPRRSDVFILINLSPNSSLPKSEYEGLKCLHAVSERELLLDYTNPLTNLSYIRVHDGKLDTIVYLQSPPTIDLEYIQKELEK